MVVFMAQKNHKMRWRLILACGLFAIGFGISALVYGVVVIAHGPFPALSSGYFISGFFIIGLGMGYLVLTPIVRNLEKNIRKLEEPYSECKSGLANYPATVNKETNPTKS